jgi:hypothetical protein
MKTYFAFFGLALALLTGCKKEQAAAPAPVVQEVAAPVEAPVQPGMEAQNPAEKEGQP